MPDASPIAVEPVTQQRKVFVRIVRMVFVVLLLTVTLLYILKLDKTIPEQSGFSLVTGWYIPLTAAIVLATVVLTIDVATPRKRISTISGVFFGLLAGMLATFALGFVIDLLVQTYEINAPNMIGAVKVLLGITMCYITISAVLQTQDDFRLVIPYVEFAKQLRGPKPLLLDSSALIDARIADLAATGLLQVPLVIPRFVIAELQALADSSDKLKRTGGRRGLDVIARLQRQGTLDVTIDETPVPRLAVDQMLVELATLMPATIVTADAALSRVATIQGVTTLNLNDVANALKPSLIPGTQLTLRLIKAGEQPSQAVGYLDDGTMVVADNARDLIGTDARLEVTSALQTSAGRLIFAKPAHLPPDTAVREAPSELESPADANTAVDDGPNAITPPVAVRPPIPAAPTRPGPLGPGAGRSNPSRNPRR